MGDYQIAHCVNQTAQQESLGAVPPSSPWALIEEKEYKQMCNPLRKALNLIDDSDLHYFHKLITKEGERRCAQAYSKGESLRSIAKRFNITIGAVEQRLERVGVKRRGPGRPKGV